MPIPLSVLLCTHQPHSQRFQRVLDALEKQSLDPALWELIVVDNASNPPLTLPSGSRGKVVRESQLGIAAARVCAFRSSQGEIGVFVDDDNVLDPDYLENCLAISSQYPFLGCWGGQSIPEYEVAPAPEMGPYLELLALRTVARISWSNRTEFPIDNPVPFGAGMCVRREIMDYHTARVEAENWHLKLGRSPTSMLPCEDTDLVFSGCDAGFGYGVFPQLILHHLIPAARTRPEYLLSVLESSSQAHYLLKHWRGQPASGSPVSWRGRVLDQIEKTLGPWLPFRLRARLAQRRGQRQAFRRIQAERAVERVLTSTPRLVPTPEPAREAQPHPL